MGRAPYPLGKATALLAYALDIEAETALPRAELDQLVDAVCEGDTERARLLSLVSTSQNPQLPTVLLELIGARLDRLRSALDHIEAQDMVYGVWAQRIAGVLIAASLFSAMTGTLTGSIVPIAIAVTTTVGVIASVARQRLLGRASRTRRTVEQTERTLQTIRDTMPPR